MAVRLSRGPFQVFTNDVLEINTVLQRIREELDEIQGLRGRALISDALEIDGDLDHDGAKVGFFGIAPVVQAAASVNLTDSTTGTADDTVAAIPDPADTPASADALRDDLVANTLPAIRNDLADIIAKVNKSLTVLRNLGLMAT